MDSAACIQAGGAVLHQSAYDADSACEGAAGGMQSEGHQTGAVLRRLADHGGGVDAITGHTVALWTRTARALVPVIGQRGMSALYARAVHLAAVQHPWLAQAVGADDVAADFSPLAKAAAEQPPDAAIAAITALFETFDRLLVTLIGASLTQRLLQPIRDVPSAGATRQDPAP